MKNRRSVAAAVLGALFSLALLAPLRASEGGAGPEAMSMGNMCMVMFGYDMIHITAYQPGKSRSEYCAEIPTSGPTILVFDIENPTFRDMPLELRIIRDPLTPITKGTDLEALTEVHRPATKYVKGTFNLEHDFKEQRPLYRARHSDPPRRHAGDVRIQIHGRRNPVGLGAADRWDRAHRRHRFRVLEAHASRRQEEGRRRRHCVLIAATCVNISKQRGAQASGRTL